MAFYLNCPEFIPDSPLRHLAGRLAFEVMEMGFANVNKWSERTFNADPFFRLYHVTKGRNELVFADRHLPLRPGHLYLLPANVPFLYAKDSYLTHYWLHFFSSAMESLPYFQQPLEVAADAVPDALGLMKSMLAEAKHPMGMASILRIDLSLRRLLLPFFEALPESLAQSLDRMNGFSQVISFMERNLDKDLTMPELAKLSGLSQNEFSASFREAFGIPPKQYLTRRRVDAARLLLMKSPMSVKEIAAKVGYRNEFFFYRIFKKCVGITPDAYRKKGNICRRPF